MRETRRGGKHTDNRKLGFVMLLTQNILKFEHLLRNVCSTSYTLEPGKWNMKK